MRTIHPQPSHALECMFDDVGVVDGR
jgi:hypothetical protein